MALDAAAVPGQVLVDESSAQDLDPSWEQVRVDLPDLVDEGTAAVEVRGRANGKVAQPYELNSSSPRWWTSFSVETTRRSSPTSSRWTEQCAGRKNMSIAMPRISATYALMTPP